MPPTFVALLETHANVLVELYIYKKDLAHGFLRLKVFSALLKVSAR